MFDRRQLLSGLAAATLAGPAVAQSARRPDGLLAFSEPVDPVDFNSLHPDPIRIRAIELWYTSQADTPMVRVVSDDGVAGVVRGSTKAEATNEIFEKLVLPHFIGRDARDLPELVRRAYRAEYEYASVPFWSALGQLEVAIWDMIGKTVDKPCHALMGEKLRSEIPMYLSSNQRGTSPEEEVDHLRERVEETGCTAIKVKIGRRMGRNTDMRPGRSEAMIKAVREAFGDGFTLYADANGAYDAPTAIEVCRMLQSYGVAMLEEPCPFEEFEMLRQVTQGADILIAGGENDSAMEKWRWHCENKGLDVLQPDPMYNGGILRCLEVQKMSEAASLLYNPHFPRNNADTAPLLHLCAVAPNLYGFQEYRSRPDTLDYAHTPRLSPVNGLLPVPDGAGWGIEYDPILWSTSTRRVPS